MTTHRTRAPIGASAHTAATVPTTGRSQSAGSVTGDQDGELSIVERLARMDVRLYGAVSPATLALLEADTAKPIR